MRLARDGDPRAVARLVTLVENNDPLLPESASQLCGNAGQAQILGLTGSPGVGKSTPPTNSSGRYRAEGQRVGVLAVDPSSPFTGGAILGDRVRMQDHAMDPGVYIRSMSSRGHLGGLAAATPQAVRVLEGAGCDIVIIETVGVGQAEVEVARLADTTLVLLAPGMGDAIQAVKAGILEIADVFVVNKADREGADATYRDIQGMIALGQREIGRVAPSGGACGRRTRRGDRLRRGRDWQASRLARRPRPVAAPPRASGDAEVEEIALGTLRGRIGSLRDGAALPELASQVAAGQLDPYSAAAELLASLEHD